MKLLKLYCILLLSFFVFGVQAVPLVSNGSLQAPMLNGYKNGPDVILQWKPVCSAESYTIQESINEDSWTVVYTGTGYTGPGTIASVPGSSASRVAVIVPTDPDVCDILPSDSRSLVLFNHHSEFYYYRIQSCDGSVCGPFSMSLMVAPEPEAPLSLVVSKVSGNSYKVTWDASFGASTYELQRKKDAQSFSTIYSGVDLFRNEELTSGLYQYRVRACRRDSSTTLRCSPYSLGNDLFVPVGVNIPAGMLHYEYDYSGRLRAVLDSNN